MVAHVIQFPVPPQPPSGNGALDIVRDYLDRVHVARIMARCFVEECDGQDALENGDHFLAWLWENGFKVVPLEGSDFDGN